MIGEEEKSRFKKMLEDRRGEIFRLHEQLIESEQELGEPEIEPEETSEKEKMFRIAELLDEREKRELEDIDWAIHKLVTGSFGVCESCGKEIAVKRLEAVPWIRLCKQCTVEGKKAPTGAVGEILGRTTAPDYEDLSGQELVAAIRDKIRYDGRVEMQELRIFSRKGMVYLEGYVPSEEERQILLDIVEDIMGLENVVDHIAVEPLFWERENRTPGEKQPEKIEEVLFEGEGADSEEEGLSTSPSDVLIPEKEE